MVVGTLEKSFLPSSETGREGKDRKEISKFGHGRMLRETSQGKWLESDGSLVQSL